MKKINSLTKEQAQEEFDKCVSSEEYFYENFIRRDGWPPYSKEEFEKYIEANKKNREYFANKSIGCRSQGKTLSMMPITPEEAFKNIEKS